MMNPLQSVYNQVVFLLSSLTWLGVIDLFLVTMAFYGLLSLVQRSPAAYLLREVLALGVGLFVITALLPLPAFDWLVRGVLLGLLVATPIIFQVQLRRLLERVSQHIGIAQVVRQQAAETALPELIQAVEAMSTSKTGALIALEGNDALDEIIITGLSSAGRVSSELLQTIFYSGTPLHDGAVIIRTDQIVAAGCVLPLTQQPLPAEKRLGTRHRACVGLSETSDALVIVVSEETGAIGLAHRGQLRRPLTIAELSDELVDFYIPSAGTVPRPTLWPLIKQAGRQLWQSLFVLQPKQLLPNLGLLLIAFLLTLAVWSFVLEQTNPIQRERMENIPLRVEGLPPDTKLLPPPPATVSAVIQTTEDVLPSLTPRSFQALIILNESSPGLHRLPVRVSSSTGQVLVLSVDPPVLDLELAPIISHTLPVHLDILDLENLSAAYELVGTPITVPDEVQVIGPAPSVAQISQIQTSVSVANASASLRELRLLKALDEQGQEVSGLTLYPNQVQVNVPIRRRFDAREVSIRAVTSGTPPADYWLSKLSVTPAVVTLQGSPIQLANIGSFIDTLPVMVSEATGDLSIQIPLDLPPDVRALDSNGNIIATVTVLAQIAARRGSMVITQPVELINATTNLTVTVDPLTVDLLLNGPLPHLREIEANPNLIRVLVDAADLSRGQSVDMTPHVITPVDIQAQVVPPSVLVKVE